MRGDAAVATLSAWRMSTLAWLACALFAATAAILLHWPVIDHGFFQSDDFVWLKLADPQSVWLSFFGTWGHADAYRPLMRVSYYIDAMLFGRNATGWHTENVLLHAANVVLFLAVLRTYRLPWAVAAAGAWLFLISPINSESVNWISGRTTLLHFAFALAAVLFWSRGLLSRSRVDFGFAGLFVALGVMTYEAGFFAPFVMACLLPAARLQLGAPLRLALMTIAGAVVIVGVLFALRALALGDVSGSTNAMHDNLFVALASNLPAFPIWATIFAGAAPLWAIGVAFLICLLHGRTALAALTLVAVSVCLYAPYAMVAGLGGRFFYAAWAPLHLISALPALLLPEGRWRWAITALAVLIVSPTYLVLAHREADRWADAGRITRQLVEATAALPKDAPGIVVDGVPMDHNLYQMAGDYYELAATVFRPPGAATVVRSPDKLPPSAQGSDLLYYHYRESSAFAPFTDKESDALNAQRKSMMIANAPQAQAAIVAAVTPTELSLRVGQTGLALASVVNTGPGDAITCTIASSAPNAVALAFQTSDPATNVATGEAGAPVNIPHGATQTFVFQVTPLVPMAGDFAPQFQCTNSPLAPTTNGVNTIRIETLP